MIEKEYFKHYETKKILYKIQDIHKIIMKPKDFIKS